MATTTTVKKTIEELKEVLSRYVKQNFRRNELLDFMSRDFSEDAGSLRALDRRLEFFDGITYTCTVSSTWLTGVRGELEGPGKLLGYRRSCVCSNIRCRSRCNRWERLLNLRRRKAQGNFTSRGPNWFHALDDHDKLFKTALSLSPFTDSLTLAAEKWFGQRFGFTCTRCKMIWYVH